MWHVLLLPVVIVLILELLLVMPLVLVVVLDMVFLIATLELLVLHLVATLFVEPRMLVVVLIMVSWCVLLRCRVAPIHLLPLLLALMERIVAVLFDGAQSSAARTRRAMRPPRRAAAGRPQPNAHASPPWRAASIRSAT